MKRRILYFSENNLQAYQVENKACILLKVFNNHEQDITDFVSYLLSDKNIPICCLIDTLQEEFHPITIPHVLGKDRQHLLSYRKKRLFDRVDYTYAVIQGREQSGRGDDKVLFAALSNLELLQPWLELILSHKVPLVGIYSVPLLSQNVLKLLMSAKHCLLVIPSSPLNTHATYGLRQSFFVEQGLQFSRLSALTEFDAETIIDQIKKTERYLINSRLLPHNEKLNTILLNNGQITGLDTLKLDVSFEIMSLESIAEKIGLTVFNSPLYLHHLIIYYLATHRVKNQYARIQDIRYYLYRLFNRGLKIAAFGLVAWSAVLASSSLYQSWQVWLNGSQTSAQIELTRAELARKRAELPQLTTDIVIIRNVVDVGRYLQSQQVSPQLMLQLISEMLKKSDELSDSQKEQLQIERIEWGIGDSLGQIFEGEVPKEAVAPPPPPPPTRNAFGQASLSNRIAPLPVKPAVTEYLEAIRVHGKIEPFDGNYPRARALFNQMIQLLTQQKAWTVTPLIAPYNITPKTRVQGGGAAVQKILPQAPFAFEIQLKHPYAKKSS
ncbi:MAG: hypothetical protein PHP00_02655 [Thiotrichaceae bacterium]|nr:hypothetical protein [Thiotrichaceae bacterium]